MSVWLAVCNTITFKSLDVVFGTPVHLDRIWVKFVYEDNWVKVKVTGAKR